MSLSKLNKVAHENSYIAFDDLDPGSYPIKKFSVMKKSQYDGEKRLLVHIKNGYVILPSRMEQFTEDKEVEKLNKLKLRFIYGGKQGNRLDFRFVMDDSVDSSCESSSDEEPEVPEHEKEKKKKFAKRKSNGGGKKKAESSSDDEPEVPEHEPEKKKKVTKRKSNDGGKKKSQTKKTKN